MFHALGQAVSRFWPLMLVFWLLVVAGVEMAAPAWETVVEDGEFAYLPDDMPSRQAEELFQKAFTKDMLASSVVLVVRRESREAGLLPSDKAFIDEILQPRIALVQLLTDISAAVTPPDGDQKKTYAAINDYLEAIWKPADDPWSAEADEGRNEELAHVEATTAAVTQAVRDWHADLFAEDDDDDDPDSATDRSTGLAERIRRQLDEADIPPESLTGQAQRLLASESAAGDWRLPDDGQVHLKEDPIILRVRTFSDKSIGSLLLSDDNQASLVVVELGTEFLIKGNREIIHRIEMLVGGNEPQEKGSLHRELLIPPGLDVALSGSATVGRDMRANAEKSADATHFWTLVLVVILLLLIYRAPVLVLVPLGTVFVSVELALDLLALLAEAGYVGLFSGIEIYSSVVMYGAGIDFCMFLIARYKEELDGGATFDEATSESISKVGSALAASAGTTMFGIGMMVFADFGKFRQAGVAMSFGLFFVLLAALTFAPALMRLFGKWAFWPQMRNERISVAPGWISPTSLIARIMRKDWFAGVWEWIGQTLQARPGTVWLATIAVMSPFVVVAFLFYSNLSYGLLSELPRDEPSVVGANAVQEHFPAGQTGPITLLVQNQRVDFREAEGRAAIEELTDNLIEHKEQLQIADIRSIAQPLGQKGQAELAQLSRFERITQNRVMTERGLEHYVSDKGDLAGHVSRIDIIVENDPFSSESIDQFEQLEAKVDELMPDELQGDSRLLFIGATPSIRDLKTVTGSDQVRIDILVIVSVFLILVLLLRKVAVSGYLILSVFFSYLVTLGLTFAFFWAIDPAGFVGLDWKVPMFLFTILIAVGEDYNIYLITRIDEEQVRHGNVHGVTVALSKTGQIISSCGLIMAGTFASLAIGGTLAAMRQLGFALAAGVLLDTFVVRPILVPSYLILLHSGRFGVLGRYLGAETGGHEPADSPDRAKSPATSRTETGQSDSEFSSKAG